MLPHDNTPHAVNCVGPRLRSVEICAGAGGMALGLERAGFEGIAHVEVDASACGTLRVNRPQWNVVECDVRSWEPPAEWMCVGAPRIDLLAGGVPCPPFSVAGAHGGPGDERDLFPTALALVERLRPRAVFLENVAGLARPRFSAYLAGIIARLDTLGYQVHSRVLCAGNYGVAQRRERFLIVAIERAASTATHIDAEIAPRFLWPVVDTEATKPTLASAIGHMVTPCYPDSWRSRQAPTIVGGSKKHGGADLGPSGSRRAWNVLNVRATSVADEPDPEWPIRLTLPMLAVLQGFPSEWAFTGNKGARFRQIGNALPPPLSEAVARCIAAVLARSPPDVAVFGAGVT